MSAEERVDLPSVADAEPAAEPTAVLDTDRAGTLAVRGGLLRTAGHAAGVLLSVGSAALMIRALGVVDTGHYVTILSLVTIAGGITEAGLAAIGMREYAQRSGDERARALRNLLGIRLALAAAGMVGALAFAVIAGWDDRLVAGTAIAGVGMMLTVLHVTYTVPLSATLKLGTVAALDLARQVLIVALVAALALAGAGLLAFLAVPTPAALAVLAVALWLVRRTMPLLPAAEWSEWMRLLRQVIPVAVATAMFVLYFRVVMIITSLVTTPEQTGYFAASFRVVEVLLAVPLILVTSAFPILARAASADRERMRYAVQRLLEGGLIAGAGLAALLVVGAPVAIDVIAGSDFEESIGVLRIQGLAFAATFLIATWSYALLSLHAHRALLLANSTAFATAVVLALVLAPAHGATGAALATLGAELALAVACFAMLIRRSPDLWPEVGIVPRVAFAFAAALAIPLALGLPALPQTLLAAAIYAGLLLVLRAVPAELWEAVRMRSRGEREG